MLAIIIIIISLYLTSDSTHKVLINLCDSHLLNAVKIAKLKAFVYHTIVNKFKSIKLNIFNFRAIKSNVISFHVIILGVYTFNLGN